MVDVTNAGNISNAINTAPEKSVPSDADKTAILDSTTSFSLAWIKWADWKAAFTAYFSGIYASISMGVTNGDSHNHNGGDGAQISYPSLAFLPGGRGFGGNYVITPSVASNNLTVAIKTLAGANPSAGDPVTIRIGNTVRNITSALSVTLNAGTNWHNSGSTVLAAQEVDYFVYIGHNETDGVTLGVSRYPAGKKYGDFSATTTNEKHIALSTSTNATANDIYENIGRYAATLSAGAGYTWTVPTFIGSNLIQRPIYETRLLTYNFIGTNLTVGNGTTNYCVYKITDTRLYFQNKFTLGSTSAVAVNPSSAAPFLINSTFGYYIPHGFAEYSDASPAAVYLGNVTINTNTILYLVFVASGTYGQLAGLSSTIPFTWTVNDYFAVNGQYEI